ncbi:FUSC family protein [Streptacidiphilus rugosus]|uniref:FUSC family protein n=1 Tax=Streptacidiphilus rugosus TaxID=405783 RepID=UPI000568F524|nr:FUSC family protein [Streptacidiphilus rugosus]
MSSPAHPRIRPLPLRGTLALRPAVGPWHRPALSVAVATLVPGLLLLALGRLDLLLYTSAGTMCALFAHALPYRERARTLVWVVLGMTASVALSLGAAALVPDAAALVLLAALVAAAQKLLCDATRLGPPGNVIFTFVSASAFFVPQRLGEVPAHLGLTLAGGAVALLVCLAPALVKAHGPALVLAAPRAPHDVRALLPLAVRVGLGCALAGLASLAAGVGHPYWAVVTAAAVHRSNTSVSWQRALQRTVGSLLGLALFTATVPLTRSAELVALLVIAVCQVGAEATITRNYWAAQVFVTPMALMLVSLGSAEPVGRLVTDRWLDTLLGAGLGVLSALVVTNRRAGDRLARALERAEDAQAFALGHLAEGAGTGAVAGADRRIGRRVAESLHELRESAEGHAGEWWQRPVPAEQVLTTEREGHRVLALLTHGERSG